MHPFAMRAWIERARRDDLVLLLDLDGTLIPFAVSVEQADLDHEATNLLDALSYSGVRIVIVSGRARQHLERVRVALDAVWWIAEHGAWRWNDGAWSGPTSAEELEALSVALADVTAIPGVHVERKSLGLCVHWRRVRPVQRAAAVAATERVLEAWLGRHPSYQRVEAVEALEVRHRAVTKANAVAWARDALRGGHVMAIGDDDTDEDMFGALREDEIAIAVRNSRMRETRAHVSLHDAAAVRAFLWWIVEMRGRREERPPPLGLDELTTEV